MSESEPAENEEPSLPEVVIAERDDAKLAVSTDENPESRVLLIDVRGGDGQLHMSEIGIAPRNVEKLKKQSTRSVMQYRSKDNALWIQGSGGRWTVRVAVPGQPAAELALDEDETTALKAALFEPLA